MKRFTILLCLLISLSYVFAQTDLRELGKSEEGKKTKNKTTIIPDNEKKKQQTLRNLQAIQQLRDLGTSRSDVVVTFSSDKDDNGSFLLFREVVRRYTWLEGLGEPITQNEANHLPYYYKLSMKNEAGHYQLVEAMHGSALTSAHPLGTYILDNDNDTTENNREWRERLLTVGRWLFAADLSGEIVLEERAYEAKTTGAKLVYAMQPVRNDSTHVTITYMDAWGYPADMNEDSSYTYGSVVYITYDRNGCDSIIDFLDGAGYRKPNTDGVDQRRYVYDNQGRCLLGTSNNCVGDYVMDNWGNCGVRFSYNDSDNSYSVVHVDSELNPMRMPAGRAGNDDTFIRCDYKRDRWGRVVEARFLTAEGADDSTLSGIHRIEYGYTDDGVRTYKHYYDIHNNPIQPK